VTPEEFERVRELFLAARALEADRRCEFLESACGHDPIVRAEVEALLVQADRPSSFLDDATPFESLRSGIERVLEQVDADPLPTRIGRYTILGRLGGGGMGLVYLAEQEHPRRKVALKVVRPGTISHSLMRRFEHEASILGQLMHPGIAQIYEAGVADVQAPGGMTARWPFFAMEYLPGEPLDSYVRIHDLGIRQRIKLIASICDAVHHAHQHGVIHRDLKPANILVDKQGHAKILDFGIARLTDVDVQTVTTQTELGQLVGTIPYMSPEQVTGVSSNIDTRSDVYALGVICYELLTGHLPYDVRNRSIPEAVRIIREKEPTRLSAVDTLFRGDLETIVIKALAKEKSRRYQSASELAADLRNFLEHRPIVARPPTTFYQLKMFARRNKALVGGVLATIVVLAIGIVGIAVQTVKVTYERNHAQEAEQRADEQRDLAERRAYAANIAAAQAALRANDVMTARLRLEAAAPRFRQWEWRHLAVQLDGSLLTLGTHDSFVWSAVYGPAGDSIVSSGRDGLIKIWDADAQDLVRVVEPFSGSIRYTTVSPDGRYIAAAVDSGLVEIFRVTDGVFVVALPGHTRTVMNIDYSADGRLIAAASYDGTARVWEADTGYLIAVLDHPHWLHDLSFSPDARFLATACRDNVARVWDLATLDVAMATQVLPTTADWDFVHSWAVEFDRTGRVVATGSHDGLIKLWDAASGDLLRTVAGHTERVRSLAFSPDGTHLASSADDGTIRICEVATGLALRTLRGHEGPVFHVAYSPDGRRLVSASADRTVRLWDARSGGQGGRLRGHENRGIPAIAISPDGSQLITVGEDGGTGVWDFATETLIATMNGHGYSAYAVAFSPDGAWAASGARDGSVVLWDVTNRWQVRRCSGHRNSVRAIDFTPDSARLASAAVDGTIRIWEVESGEEIATLRSDAAPYTAMACRPHGTQLAAATATGRVETWDWHTAERVNMAAVHEDRVWNLAYSPDGQCIVTSSADCTVRLCAADTCRVLATLRGHTLDVSAAAFSPDGTRLASISFDRTLRLWDLSTFETVLSFRAHQDWPWSVTFTPDGSSLITSGKSVRIWTASAPARLLAE
jgi:WD40 repeat protein